MFDRLTKLVSGVAGLGQASPEQYAPEVIDAMAEQMPPREGVWWAVASGKQVEPDVLSPEDLAALEAAEAWVKDPSEATASAAGEALKDVDYQGPGAWAAVAAISVPVAAALAGGAGAGAAMTAAPAAATAAGIAPKAVAGAVKLAAALKNGQKPETPQAADVAEKVADAVGEAKPESAESAPAASAANAAKSAKALKPFIDNGRDIMEGRNLW